MTSFSFVLEPHLPVWALAGLGVLAALVLAWGAYRRAKGWPWRVAFACLLLGALANPVLRQEQHDPLPDVALLVLDRSPSQGLEHRTAEMEAAAATLRKRLGELGGVDVREVTVAGDGNGTELFRRIEEALAEVDRSRLAGVVALTDGEVHDVPTVNGKTPIGAPLHVLLTGRPNEIDRALTVQEAPTFAMVGEPQSVRILVEDRPAQGSDAPVRVTLKEDGKPVGDTIARAGVPLTLPFTLDKAGPTVLELEAAPLAGELTPLNNRAVLTVNGVRDRLRVLLVSGQPYPGLRVWRNLLKADPAVDLVHFTILRPPEKQDGTPIRELALIAFPSRELFEVKLNEFDLVIFDRYSRRGLLPLTYLDNVARYVEGGGALLEAAGPGFAGPTSLYRTPLARVLPGRPSGEVFERPFVPTVTGLGGRHPVTRGLAPPPGEPGWGTWFRQIDVEPGDAQVLMTGVADRPLLILERVGKGRVAQLLSDEAWLWARGYDGGGPQAALLRRLVHWLMKEPELEEEALGARASADGIEIERRSLKQDAIEVTVTAPSGKEQRLSLKPGEDGIARARVEADENGLYRISDGAHTAYATPRPIAPAELADMRATPDRLAPVVAASGGAIEWLAEDGVPEIRRVDAGRRMHGRGWIGLERNEAYTVTGMIETPLLPAWLALALLLATATIAWWREGRA